MVFDLADFLTWQATGIAGALAMHRSTCKWTYLAHETPGWQADFLAAIGLADLLERARPARARDARSAPISAR